MAAAAHDEQPSAPATAPRIAAVVVHYGDPAPTRRCLDSLQGIDEIVLVDQPPRLVGNHSFVTKHLRPGTNLGFAGACNLAVREASAPFVLLVNNDAMLADGAVDALHDALETLPSDAAGACLKLLDMDGRRLQSAGGLWFTRDGIGWPRGFGECDRGQYDAMPEREIGVPSGAAALYRAEAWKDTGGMCDEFFCYCEDGDLGLRMIGAGWRFAWWPRVQVLHELSTSSGAHSAFKAFHVERNHFATMLHSAPLPLLALLPLQTLLRLARTASDAARGRGAGGGLLESSSALGLATTLVRAWIGVLRMAPRALQRRVELSRRHPKAQRRIARFLATRRASLSNFSKTRDLGRD